MTKDIINRKIAVILVADVVGYSKHMEKNENETLKAYSECEKKFKICLKKYNGIIFNTGGDSVLAEFPSAVNAVECGVAFQNEIKKRNKLKNSKIKLEFRIGINMGDVVKRENNLLGDGVNIASRLEAFAEPSGISISKSVYELVVNKTNLKFNDLGIQKVKQNEFHTFDIILNSSQKRTLKANFRPKLFMLLAGIALFISLISVYLYLFQIDGNERKIASTKDKPFLVIMPFENLTGNQENNYIIMGLHTSLSSMLSKNERLIVPSEETGKHFAKNETTDEEIFAKFGYRYVLRGNIQGSPENLRIIVKMNDLIKKEIIWSEKYDFKDKNDIFEIQDLLTASVLKELELKFTLGGTGDSFSKNPEVYKRQILGWSAYQYRTNENHIKAEKISFSLRTFFEIFKAFSKSCFGFEDNFNCTF